MYKYTFGDLQVCCPTRFKYFEKKMQALFVPLKMG